MQAVLLCVSEMLAKMTENSFIFHFSMALPRNIVFLLSFSFVHLTTQFQLLTISFFPSISLSIHIKDERMTKLRSTQSCLIAFLQEIEKNSKKHTPLVSVETSISDYIPLKMEELDQNIRSVNEHQMAKSRIFFQKNSYLFAFFRYHFYSIAVTCGMEQAKKK